MAASGKSSQTPPPPWAWMARSTTRSAMFGAITLMAEISIRAPLLPTVSISQAAFSVSSRAWSISMRQSAIHSWITPCSASVLPNATRPRTRRHISSSARSAMPMQRMQWWMRPGPSRAWAMANPPPSSPSRLRHRHTDVLEEQLAVALAVLVAEHRQGAHVGQPGVSIGTRIIDCCRCGARVGVGLAHDDDDLAAVARPRRRSTTCAR